MGFSSPLFSLQHNLARFASDFAGVASAIAPDGGFRECLPGACANRSVAGRILRDQGSAARAVSTEDIRWEATVAERDRIARELHDTLLQGFLGVSMQLHMAVQDLPADCVDAKSRFKSVLQLMDRVLEQGRNAVRGLRSPSEHHASLVDAIADVPAELGFHLAQVFRLTVHGEQRDLGTLLHHEAYCVAREAIANACRHSGASKIEVDLEYRPAELRISVRDNGRGIDSNELRWGRNGHWGLQGMRERADRIGARLRLLSRVGLGTEVELRIPARTVREHVRS